MKASMPSGAPPVSREVVEIVKRKIAPPAGPPPAGMANFKAPKSIDFPKYRNVEDRNNGDEEDDIDSYRDRKHHSQNRNHREDNYYDNNERSRGGDYDSKESDYRSGNRRSSGDDGAYDDERRDRERHDVNVEYSRRDDRSSRHDHQSTGGRRNNDYDVYDDSRQYDRRNERYGGYEGDRGGRGDGSRGSDSDQYYRDTRNDGQARSRRDDRNRGGDNDDDDFDQYRQNDQHRNRNSEHNDERIFSRSRSRSEDEDVDRSVRNEHDGHDHNDSFYENKNQKSSVATVAGNKSGSTMTAADAKQVGGGGGAGHKNVPIAQAVTHGTSAMYTKGKLYLYDFSPLLRATYRELRNFVLAPCPPGITMRCYIERNRSGVNMLSPFYSICADLEGVQYMLLAL